MNIKAGAASSDTTNTEGTWGEGVKCELINV